MKGKKKITRAAAAAFIATSLTATVVPVYADNSTADGDVTKDESVYTVLNADGSVSEITVSDILHSDDGFDNYEDDSGLKDVENLKSNDPVKKSSDGYTWTTKNKDIYYQGTSTKDLPLDVNITYTLDGKEMSADEMLGKSGHVQIKINVDNKEKQNYTVNGKNYTLATPFVTVAGAYLDQDKFSNVKINEGTVQSDSSHDIAAAVMIPGLREGLQDVLDADTFKTLEGYLIDDVTIDADVKNFESPSIMLAAATDMDALKDEMSDAKMTDVFGDLDKLQAATDKLQSGAQSLYDGASELNNGAGTLNNGVSSLQNGISKLTSGANQLSSGASTLYNGASQVSQGAASLQNGLGQLSANSAALNNGADQIAGGILSMANKVLDSNAATRNLPDLTMSNYADVLGAISGAAETRNATLQQVASQAGQSTDITKDLIYMAVTANPNTTWTADSLASAMTAQGVRMTAANEVQQSVSSINSKADALKNEKVQALLEGVRQQASQNVTAATNDQMNQIYAGIAAEVTTPMSRLGQNISADQANAIVAATLNQIAASGQQPNADTLQASLNTLAGQLQTAVASKNPQAVQTVQTQMAQATAAYGNNKYKSDPVYSAFANGVYQQQYQATVRAMTADQLYDQVVAQVKASNPNLDDATVAKLITYTADHYDAGKDLATQLGTSGAAMTDASGVAAAMANAVKPDGTVAINGVLDSLFTASDENKDIQSLETSLTGVKTFTEAVKTYTAGVDSAYAGAKTLASGASQVTSGAKTLSSGASQLKDGISQLSTGAATLKSGSDALANGTSQLKSGAKTLLDGMKQYNDEGISKLTKNDKISDLKDTADLLDQVKKDGKSYDNYSGISDGTDGTVKFVYKVEGVKEEKKNTASDDDKKDNRTFFQRVADLFKF